MTEASITGVDRIRNGLTRLIIIAFVIYVAFLMAKLTWYVLGYDHAQLILLDAAPANVQSQDDLGKANALARYDMFGKLGARPVKAEPKQTESAPKTKLKLILKGVFTGAQGGESGAIVEERGRGSQYYRVGDDLPGNAKLESVFEDHIRLRRKGLLESLYFDEQSTSQGAGSVALQRAQPKKRGSIDTPEQFIQEATARLAEDPARALSSVGLKAAADGQGYVYQGNNPLLAGLNLKKGDTIRTVNGYDVGNVQKDKDLMKTLYEQGNLEVEVYRDGTSFFINYPLR